MLKIKKRIPNLRHFVVKTLMKMNSCRFRLNLESNFLETTGCF